MGGGVFRISEKDLNSGVVLNRGLRALTALPESCSMPRRPQGHDALPDSTDKMKVQTNIASFFRRTVAPVFSQQQRVASAGVAAPASADQSDPQTSMQVAEPEAEVARVLLSLHDTPLAVEISYTASDSETEACAEPASTETTCALSGDTEGGNADSFAFIRMRF